MSQGKTRYKARPARRSDFVKAEGQNPPTSFRGWAVDGPDGEVAAVGGYYLTPKGAVVFSSVLGDLPKVAIFREALSAMKKINMPALCQCSEGSADFLKRLGWVPDESDDEVYRWQP